MTDIVARMKALPDLTNEKAWETIYEGAREIERLRAPAVAAQIVKQYIETTRPTGLQSWRSTIFDMDFLAKEPAAQLAQDPLFNPQS
jgi:hypothetical protein